MGKPAEVLKKRRVESRNDLKAHRVSNSLVVHVDTHGHLPDWDKIEVLQKELPKRRRKMTEAAYITSH